MNGVGYKRRLSWTLEDVVEYLKFARRHARMVAFAVSLCILAPYVNSVLESVLKIGAPKVVVEAVSNAAFFACIAGAVALFIIASQQTKRYGNVHKDAIQLNGGALMEMEMTSDEWAGRRTACIVLGIVIIIMGPAASSFSNMLPGFVGGIVSCSVLLFAAIGVFFLIYAGSVSGRFRELAKGCQRGAGLPPEGAAQETDGNAGAGADGASSTDAGAVDGDTGAAAAQAGSGDSVFSGQTAAFTGATAEYMNNQANASAEPGGADTQGVYTYDHGGKMPTWVVILLIVVAFFVINTGFNIFRGFKLFSGFGGLHLFGPFKTSHYDGDKTFDLGSIDKINVDLSQAELKIEPIDGNDVKVLYNGDFYGEPEIERGDSEVLIKEKSGFHIFGFHFGGDDGKIIVQVPKNAKLSYDLDVSTGDVRVDGAGILEARKMEIDSSAGGVALDGFRADQLDVDVSAGDLTVTGVTCTGEASLDMSTGDVTVVKSDLYQVDADLSMGDFRYELPEPKADIADRYEVDLDVSLGDIRFYDEKSNDDIAHSARKGDGERRFFHIETSMGDIQID